MAAISYKVTTCESQLLIIKTSRARKKLAEIYARMFQFYQDTIEWYLQSKLKRFARSFNENLKVIFEDAMKDLEDSIIQLDREVALGSTAMIAMLLGKVSHLETEVKRQRRNYDAKDTLAGHRMQAALQANWMQHKHLQWAINSANLNRQVIDHSPRVEDVSTVTTTIKPKEIEAFRESLAPFIIGEEGPALFDSGQLWSAEDEILFILNAWMTSDEVSTSLWISSPFEPGIMVTGSRAAALATVAAAWQAEAPVISYFCKRPNDDEMRSDMSIEQIGLMGLVYGFISQLLQLNISEVKFDSKLTNPIGFDGTISSWDISLEVLRVLLEHTPPMMFCVIDGLNELEFGNGAEWCKQILDLLKKRQQQAGAIFNILYTTDGPSQFLSSYVDLKDQHMTTKKARQIERSGRRIDLHSM
jgi:hypothetical protein